MSNPNFADQFLQAASDVLASGMVQPRKIRALQDMDDDQLRQQAQTVNALLGNIFITQPITGGVYDVETKPDGRTIIHGEISIDYTSPLFQHPQMRGIVLQRAAEVLDEIENRLKGPAYKVVAALDISTEIDEFFMPGLELFRSVAPTEP